MNATEILAAARKPHPDYPAVIRDVFLDYASGVGEIIFGGWVAYFRNWDGVRMTCRVPFDCPEQAHYWLQRLVATTHDEILAVEYKIDRSKIQVSVG